MALVHALKNPGRWSEPWTSCYGGQGGVGGIPLWRWISSSRCWVWLKSDKRWAGGWTGEVRDQAT